MSLFLSPQCRVGLMCDQTLPLHRSLYREFRVFSGKEKVTDSMQVIGLACFTFGPRVGLAVCHIMNGLI